MSKVDDSLQLKIRCRHSMSLVFDSIWRWREDYQARGRGTLDCQFGSPLSRTPWPLAVSTNVDSSAETTDQPRLGEPVVGLVDSPRQYFDASHAWHTPAPCSRLRPTGRSHPGARRGLGGDTEFPDGGANLRPQPIRLRLLRPPALDVGQLIGFQLPVCSATRRRLRVELAELGLAGLGTWRRWAWRRWVWRKWAWRKWDWRRYS